MFGFVALQAVIVNKAMSLVVVCVALPARLAAGFGIGVVAAIMGVAGGLLLGTITESVLVPLVVVLLLVSAAKVRRHAQAEPRGEGVQCLGRPGSGRAEATCRTEPSTATSMWGVA